MSSARPWQSYHVCLATWAELSWGCIRSVLRLPEQYLWSQGGQCCWCSDAGVQCASFRLWGEHIKVSMGLTLWWLLVAEGDTYGQGVEWPQALHCIYRGHFCSLLHTEVWIILWPGLEQPSYEGLLQAWVLNTVLFTTLHLSIEANHVYSMY